MAPGKHVVAIFSKYPTPGKSKTRLVPALGEEGAAQCQRVMTERLVKGLSSFPVILWYTGASEASMRFWLGRLSSKLKYYPQPSGNLGERMAHTFATAFAEGYEKVVLVGADIPGIDKAVVTAAFAQLETSPMVIHPALDGGYVLVGLRCTSRDVLRNMFEGPDIDWGTDQVLRQQREKAKGAGVECKIIGEPLGDVDFEEDLPVFEAATGVRRMALKNPTVSVIVPALNEASNLEKFVTQWIERASKAIEVVVADGGSTDDTATVVKHLQQRFGDTVKLVSSNKGRGCQLRTGTDHATGDVFITVHADTELPANFDELAVDTLRTPGIVAGAFEFSISSSSWKYRIVEYGTNLRARKRELPYGDQAIFVTARTLREYGSFSADHALLEDVELVTRLRRFGHIGINPTPVVTSDRRWRKHGVMKVTVSNQLVLLAYSAGVSPASLSRWYYSGTPGWAFIASALFIAFCIAVMAVLWSIKAALFT